MRAKQIRRITRLERARMKADDLFSKLVIARDVSCITCGEKQDLECSHFYTKKARPAARYDFMNGHAQCKTCHSHHHHFLHSSYHDYMKSHYNEKERADFELRSRGIQKRNLAYYVYTFMYLSLLTPENIEYLTWPRLEHEQ